MKLAVLIFALCACQAWLETLQLEGNIADHCGDEADIKLLAGAATSMAEYALATDDFDLKNYDPKDEKFKTAPYGQVKKTGVRQRTLKGPPVQAGAPAGLDIQASFQSFMSCATSLEQCLIDSNNNWWFCQFICGLKRRSLLKMRELGADDKSKMADALKREICKTEGLSPSCKCQKLSVYFS